MSKLTLSIVMLCLSLLLHSALCPSFQLLQY